MLYFGGIAAGEGIAGRAGFAIGTAPLQSCMGIAFLTRDFSYGGLYHYPASGADTHVQATIRRMLNDISPGIIIITPAQSDRPDVGRSDPAEPNRVKELLKLIWPGAETAVAKPAQTAHLRWRNGKPEINTGAPDEAKHRYPPDSMRNMPHPSGRELLGGAWYYGGRVPGKAAVVRMAV